MKNKGILGPNARRPSATRLHARRAVSLAVAALFAYAAYVEADDPTSAAPMGDAWTFSLSPYLWAAGINGEAGTIPGLPPADVDEGFSDIVNDLQFSGMLFYSARKGRFGISGDIQYVQTLTKDNALAPLFARNELSSKSFVFSVLGEYLLVDDERSTLRLAGGARLWSVENELKLSTGLLPGTSIKGEETWVDPVVGMSGRFNLGPKVFLSGWAFVGGFGVGADVTADLFAGVGYRVTDSISSTLGYRWVKVDYENNASV